MPGYVITTLNIVVLASGLLLSASMLVFAAVSARENEPRAQKRALVASVIVPIPFVALVWLGTILESALPATVILTAEIALLCAIILPFGNNFPEEKDVPAARFDERDIMFSRRSLKPGTERYRDYYRDKPEKEQLDLKFRRRAGLLRDGALYYDPIPGPGGANGRTTIC
jgi:hypothetical protein